MRVLILCHGNINRSAALAEILRSANIEGLEVRGGGLKAKPGQKAAKKMRDAMAEYGVDLSRHRSHQVTQEDVDWADTVLVMDGGNKRRFDDQFPQDWVKMAKAGHFCNPPQQRIPDPAFYRRDSEEFKSVVQLLLNAGGGLKEYCRARIDNEKHGAVGSARIGSSGSAGAAD